MKLPTPNDFAKTEKIKKDSSRKVPASTRIRKDAKEIIEQAASKQGKSFAWLAAQVLELYAKNLSRERGESD